MLSNMFENSTLLIYAFCRLLFKRISRSHTKKKKKLSNGWIRVCEPLVFLFDIETETHKQKQKHAHFELSECFLQLLRMRWPIAQNDDKIIRTSWTTICTPISHHANAFIITQNIEGKKSFAALAHFKQLNIPRCTTSSFNKRFFLWMLMKVLKHNTYYVHLKYYYQFWLLDIKM